MTHPAYVLDKPRREATLAGIREGCERRNWGLIAVHVRTNHVHVVVMADRSADPVMIALKAYASRHLNRIEPDCRRWTKHGSTHILWNPDAMRCAVQYVVAGQGDPMEVYRGE